MSTKRAAAPGKKPAPQDMLFMDLYDQPGHLIRRAQQIAVSMFHETIHEEISPMQYAILRMLQECPGIDQLTLAGLIALDKSTTAEIAVRLASRGLINRDAAVRRQLRLTLTPAGEAALASMVPSVHELRDRMLASLTRTEQKEFIRLLKKFVHLNNAQSRAPFKSGKPLQSQGKP